MSDLAYRAVRDAILSGQLGPGERLNQDELARRLGVSRAPIRDALNRLEAEGLVKTLSRVGGLTVAETSEQEMVDIYEFRAILDSASTRLACERMGDADLARLQGIVQETEAATEAKDLQRIVQTHAAFHELLYTVSGNAELIRVARNLWDRSYRFRLLALSNEENARRGLEQHRAILVAIQARDPRRAVALAEEHDRSSVRHLRSRMKPVEDQRGSGPTTAVDPREGQEQPRGPTAVGGSPDVQTTCGVQTPREPQPLLRPASLKARPTRHKGGLE